MSKICRTRAGHKMAAMCRVAGRHAARWGVGVGLLAVLGACSAGRVVRPENQALPKPLAEFAAESGVKIEALDRTMYWLWICRAYPATSEQISEGTKMLSEELAQYPPEFFQRIKLARVVLCGRMRDREDDVDGLFWGDTVYLGTAGGGDWGEDWRRHALHHEIFHILDSRNGSAHDAEWKACNPPDFRYGGTVCSQGHVRGEGFLHVTGRTDMGQDKAHHFAFMVRHYAAVRELGGREAGIAAKTDLIERIAAEVCPAIGPEFWAAARKRSESIEDRAVASLRYEWASVTAGVDPLAPNRPLDKRFIIVRPTRFPGSRQYRMEMGRMTDIGTVLADLVGLLYWENRQRCILPQELKNTRFDVIACLPESKHGFDRTFYDEIRREFESRFHISTHKEIREVDVHVVKQGRRGTELLAQAAERCRRAKAALGSRPSSGPGQATDGPVGAWTGESSRGGFILESGKLKFVLENMRVSAGLSMLEGSGLDRPIVDETGFKDPITVTPLPYEFDDVKMLRVFAKALGLEISQGRRPIEMTVLRVGSSGAE